MLAGKKCGRREELAIITDRVFDRKVIALADHVVFLTMAGCRVDGAGSGIQRDMIAHNDRDFPIIKGVLKRKSLERGAGGSSDGSGIEDAPAFQRIFEERFGDDQVFLLFRAFEHDVIDVWP